ncbi:hypothetical protein LOTGIDRAFT_159257 [Lottia gigantea]|uniref:Peptidase S1 domain-containing protein n=1 Tax=Lottia gigantea TaxID=225164 RepID=V4AU46_LOTGI|nr:hypothetical protein LOTGIDRAFT_159257 [Lottia gigantea]ESO98450.1 hypothetical protein LOTGIDRAFT_159257 [Lottia gigantea]
MAELFQTCFIFTVVLWFNVLSTSSAAYNFNWCYFFNGDCLVRCPNNRQPLGTYSNFAIKNMLCGNSGWCCPRSYYVPPPGRMAGDKTTTTTSTTTTTTTTTAAPTTTTTTEPTTTLPPSTTRYLSAPGCGVRGPSTKIIGGIQAQYCEFQYMAYIHLEGSPCGGAIIDDRHIITAAHCLWDLNGHQPEVVIGEYNRSRFEPNFEFKTTNYRKVPHGAYNSRTYENDIAIIKLREPIDFSQFRCLRPICRPDKNLKFPVNTLCTVTGWGVTAAFYDDCLSHRPLKQTECPVSKFV